MSQSLIVRKKLEGHAPTIAPPPVHPRHYFFNGPETLRIIRHRQRRWPIVYPATAWRVAIFSCLILTILSALLLDGRMDAITAAPPAWIIALARSTSPIGLGGWYLVPAAGLLITAGATNWSSLSRRAQRLIFNWTSLVYFVLISMGLAGLLVTLLKRIIGRARPAHLHEHGVFAFRPFATDAYFASFPSGHATIIGCLAATLVLLFPRSRYIVIPVGLWLAATRVFVGAHYPSDVVAGFGFGFAFTVAAAIIFARFGFIFRPNGYGLPKLKRAFRLLP